MVERKRIGLREVRALGLGEVIWDATVRGFHARRQRGPAITYAVFYRTRAGRQRWHKIGRHGAPWTPESAREEALIILGSVANGPDRATHQTSSRGLAVASVTRDDIEHFLHDVAEGDQPPIGGPT
jgi:hypothetical protein